MGNENSTHSLSSLARVSNLPFKFFKEASMFHHCWTSQLFYDEYFISLIHVYTPFGVVVVGWEQSELNDVHIVPVYMYTTRSSSVSCSVLSFLLKLRNSWITFFHLFFAMRLYVFCPIVSCLASFILNSLASHSTTERPLEEPWKNA